jgi:hypothetical protein
MPENRQGKNCMTWAIRRNALVVHHESPASRRKNKSSFEESDGRLDIEAATARLMPAFSGL